MPKVSELIQVLGQHPVLKFFRNCIDNRNNCITIRDFQRSPGTKIVLHINNQQTICIVLYHFDFRYSELCHNNISAIIFNNTDVIDDITAMKLYHQADRVFNELNSLGIKDKDPVDVSVLSAFDQYHYLGTDAVDEAIKKLDIDSSMEIMEIGAGIGGPARYLAHTSGCKMTALELQPELNSTAMKLTARCRLQGKVTHLCGDILDGLPENKQYDALVSWLTFLHIPDRPTLYSNCFAALKPGTGIYVEDYFERNPLTDQDKLVLRREVYCDCVPTMSEYFNELSEAGFTRIELVDKSAQWTEFVVERQSAFENARERNENLHGKKIVNGLSEFYRAIVNLFTAGNLGGVCFTAWKPG